MSSPAATSSSHYCILDSEEAHNYFDHTNRTAKLCDYILEPHPNHIDLTLDQNITPTDLNLLRIAIGCARSRVALIETIKKLEDSIIDIASILVDRDVNMLLLSRPINRPKLETPSTPSLPSSAKVSESRTPPSLLTSVQVLTKTLPQLIRHRWPRNHIFKNPLVEPETDAPSANALVITAPLVPYPPALLAEPEPLAIMATFARNTVKDRHHPDVHPQTPTVSPSLNTTTMMMLLRDFIKKRPNTILTLGHHRAR